MCYRFDSYMLYISLDVFALMDMNEYKNHILNKSNYCREDIHISLDLFCNYHIIKIKIILNIIHKNIYKIKNYHIK